MKFKFYYCFSFFLDANLSAEDSVVENGLSNGLNENSNPLSSRSLMDEPGSIGGGDPLGTFHILRKHFYSCNKITMTNIQISRQN